MSKLLSDLTKKDCTWNWGVEQQNAFEVLKKVFTTAPVLRIPNDKDPFKLSTDASDFAKRYTNQSVALSSILFQVIRYLCITNGHLLDLWWIEIWIQKCLWAELDKQQKMLLSLRSNPQTMSPYIHNCDGLCTSTDHHMLLPIVLHMVVPLYLK